MSLECSECERDLRGGHASNCSRNPNARKTVDVNKEINELKAHVERLREAAEGLLSAIEYKKQMPYSDYPIDSISALAKEVFDETPAQSINHIKAQVEEETIERCVTFANSNWDLVFGDVYDLETMPRKYKEQ